MQHLIDTNDFNDTQLIQLMHDARVFKSETPSKLLENKLLITLFFESSTRTRSSFEIAAKRLGVSVVHLDPSKSSTNKGESLEDTFENLAAMEPDGVIIRHEYNNTPKKLADKGLTPIINAGAGNNAHPTQALLDCFTMMEHFGVEKPEELKGKRLAIVGDILHSRVARSQIHALNTLCTGEVRVIGPKTLIPKGIEQMGVRVFHDMNEGLNDVDVIIMLRLQKERMTDALLPSEYEYFKRYGLSEWRLSIF